MRRGFISRLMVDPLAERPSTVQQLGHGVVVDDPEVFEEEWDDSLDGEGEPDVAEEHDHEVASNESSVTLSSKTSSKRTYHEVDDEVDDLHSFSPPSSPGPSLFPFTMSATNNFGQNPNVHAL
jgi:hypothetical protein